MARKELLGKTKSGRAVWLDVEKSHATTHFADQPRLREFVEKLIPTLDEDTDQIRIEKDMGEVVGTSDLAETSEGDEIVYARRPRRVIYSRFVKGKEPTPTNWITVNLKKGKNGDYFLYTAFVGRNTPSIPGGDYLPEQSREFWSNHALIWGAQEVEPGTETTECPW